jgi:hypothetical protein
VCRNQTNNAPAGAHDPRDGGGKAWMFCTHRWKAAITNTSYYILLETSTILQLLFTKLLHLDNLRDGTQL